MDVGNSETGMRTVQVELYSEKRKSLKVETINLSSSPATIKTVKDKIEECCSVPSCVQRVFYEKSELPDDCSLESLCLRKGNTLGVSYPIEGETKDVEDVIQWLRLVTSKIQEIFENSEGEEFTIPNDQLYTSSCGQVLTITLFSPWSDPVKHVNAKHFVDLHGPEWLANLHHQLLYLKKCKLSRIIYRLEYVLVTASANFTMSQSCARSLYHCGELDNCITTLLMKPVYNMSVSSLFSTVEGAMLAILNIAELPEVQKYLSGRDDVIKQYFHAAATRTTLSNEVFLFPVILLLLISRYQGAQENLLKPKLVGDVLDLCKRSEATLESSEFKALKTYAGLFFAQVICGSTYLLKKLPVSTLTKIKSLMQQVCHFNPMELRMYEAHDGFIWQSFLNCVEYLYVPLSEVSKHFTKSLVIEELYHFSIETLLHFLESALGREEHVSILVDEDLMDYVVALPWNVQSDYKDRAKRVVKEITKVYPVEPLSLSSLVKVKLAKSTWGLKKIMEIQSVRELI